MTIASTLTKKLLENIVHESFLKFGRISSSSLLDSLKLLGFSYATSAGVSINIEDLKTPNSKKESIEKANNKTQEISVLWKKGELSDTERFQAIIDNWNYATESLKNKIIDYYQNYDPTNNLYIMAFSGARGNMSQVRQLVGMRGLMSDQEGKIIDLPIQSNFREGLSPIDYIISSYGARKGIVDTALKTADSGYLTRRLIYVAQDLVIRQRDCGTKKGILFLLEKMTFSRNLVGNFLISTKLFPSFQKNSSDSSVFSYQNTFLDEEKIENLKKFCPLILNLRSSLTCKSMNSVCQYCYGWDLAQGKKISLGEAVGIIAAQSIGEPGTQLTMRTFHTGGIFTSELVTQIIAPFSGRILFPDSLQLLPFRTSHGILVSKLQQEINLFLLNWEGKKKEIFLDIGSFVYVSPFSFVKKGQTIAEFMNQTIIPGKRKLKPIFSPISGEIRFQNLSIRKIPAEKKTLKLIHERGLLWITSGKLISVPKESEINFIDNFSLKKPIFFLFFSSPISGFVKMYQEKIFLLNKEKKISLNFKKLNPSLTSMGFNFSFFIKNYQYLDAYTLFASIFLFSDYEGKIYLIRTKNSKYNTSFLFITEEDIWKVHCEQKTEEFFWQKTKSIVKQGSLLSPSLKAKYSGIFINQDGLKMIFQYAFPIFLSEGAVLNSKQGDFVVYKKTIANLVNYIQQTEDIVQGLPKIEDLIEARKPKRKSYLSVRPGVFLNSFSISEKPFLFDYCFFENQIFSSLYKYIEFPENVNQKKEKSETGVESSKLVSKKVLSSPKKKQIISIAHSIFLKDTPIIFRNQTYKAIKIPEGFHPFKKRSKTYVFKNSRENILQIGGKSGGSNWSTNKLSKGQSEYLFHFFQNKLETYDQLQANHSVFKNKINQLIVFTEKKGAIFLEPINSLIDYEIPLTSKIIYSPGQFIDIGEPFTEGMIDIDELLQILFQYHSTFDDLISGSLKGLQKFQLILVHSIQAIYQSQGINISSKHIEIIVRQMTNKVIIKASGDTPFLIGESIRLSLIIQIAQSLRLSHSKIDWKIPKFQPLLLSATHSSLTKAGFLSSAGFQETKRVLTKAAMEGTSDWLRGLKECVIIGRIIPAGSAFLNYKNYLDNLYFFKKK